MTVKDDLAHVMTDERFCELIEVAEKGYVATAIRQAVREAIKIQAAEIELLHLRKREAVFLKDCAETALRKEQSRAVTLEAEKARVLEVLRAIAEGYAVSVHDDRYISVENPDYRPDDGSDRNLVIDVAALAKGGNS